jgi:hypothetical protein
LWRGRKDEEEEEDDQKGLVEYVVAHGERESESERERERERELDGIRVCGDVIGVIFLGCVAWRRVYYVR